MKLCYYLACIGEPNLNTKIDVLHRNINYLGKQLQEKIDIIVNYYDIRDTAPFLSKIKENQWVGQCYLHQKPGVLVELWLTNPHHKLIENYNYIFFCLDDIKIIELNLLNLVAIKKKYHLDLISPCVQQATHKFLMTNKNNRDRNLYLTNAIEIFCLLLEPKDFKKYMNIQDIDNKWIWGVDFMLGYFGLKCGIYMDYKVRHLYPQRNGKFRSQASRLMGKYLKKHNFSSLRDVRGKYPPIKKRLKI